MICQWEDTRARRRERWQKLHRHWNVSVRPLKAKNGIHNFDTLWTCGLVVKIVKINCTAFSINGLEWNARDALGKEYLAENPRISNRQTPPKKPSLRTTRRRGVVDWLVGILSFMCISLSLSLFLSTIDVSLVSTNQSTLSNESLSLSLYYSCFDYFHLWNESIFSRWLNHLSWSVVRSFRSPDFWGHDSLTETHGCAEQVSCPWGV